MKKTKKKPIDTKRRKRKTCLIHKTGIPCSTYSYRRRAGYTGDRLTLGPWERPPEKIELDNRTYTYIVDFAESHNGVFPEMTRVAREMGVGVGAMRGVYKKLIADGRIEKRDGKYIIANAIFLIKDNPNLTAELR